MKASVIINTFNESPSVLKRAVDSFLCQTIPVQIIISTVEGDRSVEWVKKETNCCLATLPLSKHPGKSPAGAYAQINNALKLISRQSEYLCYASGNDVALPHKIETEILCCKTSGKEVCYSAFNLVSVNGGHIETVSLPEYTYEDHLKNNFVSDCSLISMRIVKKFLPYKTNYGNFAHWDSWLRIYESEGNVFFYNPVPTWKYFQNPSDMSKQRNTPEKVDLYIESQKKFIDSRK